MSRSQVIGRVAASFALLALTTRCGPSDDARRSAEASSRAPAITTPATPSAVAPGPPPAPSPGAAPASPAATPAASAGRLSAGSPSAAAGPPSSTESLAPSPSAELRVPAAAAPRDVAAVAPPSAALDRRLTGLAHAPFDAPAGAPSALVHAPAGALDGTGPVHVVLFLHGYSGCVDVIASDASDARCTPGERRGHAGLGVVTAHDAAATRTVLVIPQLSWMTRDGSPGRFARAGEARAFLDEVLTAAGIARPPGRVTIAAHSAAFETTIAILRQGGLDDVLRDVVLLDALYSGGPAFLGWVRGGSEGAPRTLVSLHTGGTPARRGVALARDARAWLGTAALDDPDAGLAALLDLAAPARVLVLHVAGAHGDVPRRHLAAALGALGLPSR